LEVPERRGWYKQTSEENNNVFIQSFGGNFTEGSLTIADDKFYS